jgi:predicted lipoprotein with Yx(FWY)xxD motif
LAAAGAVPVGKYTIVTRDDGSTQWAYDGKPLYGWKNDKQPGDTTGDGVGGKWHTAKP